MKPMRFIALLLAFQVLNISSVSSQENPEKETSFILALCQMKVLGGDRTANLKHAGEMIARAASEGAKIILLPEAMDLGWTDPSALTEAEPVPEGKTCSYLAVKAREHQVYICSGLIEKAGDKVYNSAVIINPEGELILLHRKINELDIGHPYYALGDRLNVCHTEFGTLGLSWEKVVLPDFIFRPSNHSR